MILTGPIKRDLLLESAVVMHINPGTQELSINLIFLMDMDKEFVIMLVVHLCLKANFKMVESMDLSDSIVVIFLMTKSSTLIRYGKMVIIFHQNVTIQTPKNFFMK